MQPLAILFGALLAVAASFALGRLALGESCRDPGARFVVGAAILSLTVFVLCCLGAVYQAVLLAIGAASLVGLRGVRLPPLPPARLLAAAFLAYFVLYFFNAMAPEISFDGSRYHLGLVGAWVRGHGFHRITDNMYAALPQGVEMLYLFAFAFGKHSAASMVHFVFLLALVWQMIAWGRRAGLGTAASCAALLVFATPLVGADATSAYNDVAVAAIVFTLFHLLQLWDESRSTRVLAAAGLIAGLAFAAKYTAWTAVPYALAFVVWKSRRPRDVAIVAVAASLLIAPWLVRNWIWFHNPVAPFYNGIFPNPLVTIAFERGYRAQQATRALSDLLIPTFLLAPLALIAVRTRAGRQLLLAAAIFSIGWWSNANPRFLLPALPFAILAVAIALQAFPRVLLAITLLNAVISWPSILRYYAPAGTWHLVKIPYREALRIKPEDGFLESNLPLYGAARLTERATPPGATIFTLTPVPEAYTACHIRVAYQSASNIASRDLFWEGFIDEHQPVWQLRFAFPRQSLRAVRAVQTGTGSVQWSMHELRAFDGPTELARDRWTATASSFPFTIDHILDGRPLTFWRAGETLRPGQFVAVTFPESVTADAVLIEAAPDQHDLRLRLEGQNAAGQWMTLAAPPDITSITPPPDIRRGAAEELRRAGNDYLLLFDGEFGASDVAAHAAEWGVREVGEYKGARLYQLP